MFDVAIIGAGPAGATLARLLGSSHRVLLLDRRPLDQEAAPGGPEKCCGGLLAPDAQEMLARLRLGVPREVLVGPQLFTVRTIDVESNLERYYQRHYINVDRERFDRWLVSLVPGSVDFRAGARLASIEEDEEGCRISFTCGAKQFAERSRFLVGADGATSRVRRLLFPERPWPRTYIAIQEWFDARHPPPHFSSIFDARITDFYSWTIPKEETLLVGAALPPGREAGARFARLKGILADRGFCLGRPIRRSGAFLLRPRGLRHLCLGRGRVALAGEAAGLISPSSAEGISYAFRSALALARAFQKNPSDCLRLYGRGILPLKINILQKSLKAALVYSGALRRMVMRSGILSLEVEP